MNDKGIMLAVIGTTAYNAGFVLEKRALTGLPSIDVRAPWQLVRTLFTAPAWLLGLLCMVIGLGCQLFVLQLLPISVAQPLQAAGIGVLLLLAWLVLGERPGRRDWWRLVTIVVAVLLLGLSGDAHTQPGTRPADPLAIIAVLVLSALLAVGMSGAVGRGRQRRVGRHRRQSGRSGSGVSAGLAAGLCYGIAGLGLKASSSQVAHHSVVGMVALLLRSPYPYLVVCASGVGMLLFQTALQRFRASVVIPTSNVAGSCYVLALGTWLFHESLPTQPVALTLRVAGLVTTVLALVIQPDQTGSPAPAARPFTVRPRVPTNRHARSPIRRKGNVMALDERLLEILACPIDKGALLYFTEDGVLYNPRLRRLHRIEADVPLMRADQSDTVDSERHRQLLSRAASGAAVGTIGRPVTELLAAENL